MDARPVKIHLKSTLQGIEERFEYDGLCRKKGSLYCITYTDLSDSAVTRVRIDAAQSGMTLLRQGSITARMQFSTGKQTSVKYKADAFSADFLLKTELYRFVCDTSSIKIFLQYALTETGGGPVSEVCQEMEITFTDGSPAS